MGGSLVKKVVFTIFLFLVSLSLCFGDAFLFTDLTGVGSGSDNPALDGIRSSLASESDMAMGTYDGQIYYYTWDEDSVLAESLPDVVAANDNGSNAGRWILTSIKGSLFGPSSATDNAIVLFDGATGGIVQNSGVTVDDSNNITTSGGLTATGTITGTTITDGTMTITGGGVSGVAAITAENITLSTAVSTESISISGGAISLSSAASAPSITSSKIYNTTGDLYWDGNVLPTTAYPSSQQVYVSENGGSDTEGTIGRRDKPFATIQAAIDAITDSATDKRYSVNIAAGEYAETITAKNYVCIQGEAQGCVTITGATGPLLTLPSTLGAYSNLTFNLLPTTDSQTIISGTDSGLYTFRNCAFNITSSTNGIVASVVDVTDANLTILNSSSVVVLTGSAAGAKNLRIFDIDGTSQLIMYTYLFNTRSADIDDNIHQIYDASSGILLLGGITSFLTETNSSFSGTATTYESTVTSASIKSISSSYLTVTGAGAGTAYGFVVDTATNDGTITTSYNIIDVSGFAGNYHSSIATGDTHESHLTKMTATEGVTGAGTYRQNPLWDLYNGMVEGALTFTVTSDGSDVTANVSDYYGGDITLLYSSGRVKFDTTPAATVALTAGSDVSPQLNYVYILKSNLTLTASTTGFPSSEHTPLATVLVQSAASLQTYGAYKVHVWQNEIKGLNGGGHLNHINRWIRYQHATWLSGVAPTTSITVNAGAIDNVYFSNTSGVVLQVHTHTFPATSMGTGASAYVVNDSTTAYDRITDLSAIDTDSAGVGIRSNNDYYSLVVWGVVSQDTADCKLMVNAPSGKYSNAADANADPLGYSNFTIPAEYKGTGFLIARVVLRYQTADSGTLTEIQTEDLRGLTPSTTAGGGGGAVGSTEFSDNLFRIQNVTDTTKELAFDLSGITTSTTRTLTIPDSSGTVLLDTGGTVSFTTSVTAPTIYTNSFASSTEAISFSNPITVTGGISGTLIGNRNAIINGDFPVWQRGTSFAAVASGTYTSDRFLFLRNTAEHTISRDTDVPTQAESGHKSNYSIKIACTTIDASIDAGDFVTILQRIEGYNFAPLMGKTATLSFWVKAVKTGTYCVAFQNSVGDKCYIAEYTVDTTETWEKKTITLTFSDSGGTWDYTTGIGLRINWTIASGSTYQGAADTWSSSTLLATANQVNGVDSTDNNFWLSQIQLEPGEVATDFEYEQISTTLAKCWRYYRIIAQGLNKMIGILTAYDTTFLACTYSFPTMRSAPTLEVTSGSGYYGTYQASPTSFDSFSGANISTNSILLYKDSLSGLTANDAFNFWTLNASAYVALSAEL